MSEAADQGLMPEIHETHSGVVVLVGDRAYKAKKPVTTDFLDFSTVALRERACARELELNRRLAPNAYLGIAHLSGPEPGSGEPVLVMRRYPDSARLSTRVAVAGHHGTAEIASVAGVLANFHRGARRGAEVDHEAAVPAVTRRWEANLAEMSDYAGTVVDAGMWHEVGALTHRFLAGCRDLFAARIAEGRIVDGHADLLANDIFITDGEPVLLDCLDFDDRLRYVDGLDDAAFLAMDLEFHGRADLAERFLSDYRRLAADPAPPALADFYIAYRAVVRAKVDCIRVDQGHAAAGADAGRHLRIALDHLRAAIPRLVLIGGGPGTGKTTVARGLAEELGAEVISTDDVRAQLRADGVIAGQVGVLGTGLYAPGNVAVVYDEVLRRAAGVLAGGRSVILDGTWRDPAQRRRARELADRSAADVTEIVCATPLAVAQDRIATRTATTSDATGEIAAALAESADTVAGWPQAHPLDTGRPAPDVVAEAVGLCRKE